MSTEQTSTLLSPGTAPRPDVVLVAAPTLTPTARRFAPPRLTKMGKVADLTQGGLGGSLDFP